MSGGPKRRPTSFDVAERAGVSQPTVSRALSGSPAIAEATRRKVIEEPYLGVWPARARFAFRFPQLIEE